MESMKEIKDWFVSKCRIGPFFSRNASSSEGQKDTASKYTAIVTPQSIPEFVIPGSGDSSRRTSESSDICSRYSFSSVGSAHPSPRGSWQSLIPPQLNKPFSSAPVTPRHEARDFVPLTITCSEYLTHDDTNADPQSFAAMGLDHFKMRTSFGFTTLSESPHTRRKESLFHCSEDAALLAARKYKVKSRSCELVKRESKLGGSVLHDVTNKQRDVILRQSPSIMITPFSLQSCDGELSRSSSLDDDDDIDLMSQGPEQYLLPRKGRLYYRRRSSLYGLNDAVERFALNGFSEPSSTENSPELLRKNSDTLAPFQAVPIKRHSAPDVIDTPDKRKQFASNRTCSCQSLSKVDVPLLAENGELKFSFQYFPDTKQLRVFLIRAENLAGKSKTDANINPFVKVYLMPGKVQKQVSEVKKHCTNPIFNQEFLFFDLDLEEIIRQTLRIKAFHKEHNLKRAEFLGEVNINLESYNLLQENRMWKNLEGKGEREEIGFLQMALTFEPREEKLTIMIVQVKNLSEHSIKGLPDPYVRLEVSQPGRAPVRNQTRTRKKTSHPVFKESFTFSISPKFEDLRYTAVTVRVFNRDRLLSDELIGHVHLGYGSTENSEMVQWNETMLKPGKEINGWHYLIEPSDNNT